GTGFHGVDDRVKESRPEMQAVVDRVARFKQSEFPQFRVVGETVTVFRYGERAQAVGGDPAVTDEQHAAAAVTSPDSGRFTDFNAEPAGFRSDAPAAAQPHGHF